MNRAEFINEFQYELDGLILDAVMARHREGAELSLWLKQSRARVQTKLGAMYDALILPNPVKEPTNDDDRQGKVPSNNGQGGAKPPQPAARTGAQPAPAGAPARR